MWRTHAKIISNALHHIKNWMEEPNDLPPRQICIVIMDKINVKT